jgi:hypothetical protein
VATAALQLGAESSDSYLKRKLEFEGEEKKLGSSVVVTESQRGEKVRHFVAPIWFGKRSILAAVLL